MFREVYSFWDVAGFEVKVFMVVSEVVSCVGVDEKVFVCFDIFDSCGRY